MRHWPRVNETFLFHNAGDGAKYFLGEFWIYPYKTLPAMYLVPADGLNLVYEQRVERFYRDLPRYGMSCPICGAECKCGALIRLFSLS